MFVQKEVMCDVLIYSIHVDVPYGMPFVSKTYNFKFRACKLNIESDFALAPMNQCSIN